jgi:hypothetical protein
MILVHDMSERALLDGYNDVRLKSRQEKSLSFIVAMANPISNVSVFKYH